MKRLLKPVAAMTVLVFAGQSTCFAQPRQLPDFGTPADTVLSKNRERQLGYRVLLQLRNAGVIVDDPLLTEYIKNLGAKLSSQANNGDFDFDFFFVDDDSINAFAMPGGHIGVNTGLMTATENESELASVLAHEVSHVTQRHAARAMYDTQKMSIVSIATMLAAIALGAAGGSADAVNGVMMGGQAAAAQRQINFTRQNEYEADRIGIDVLYKAGFDPMAMASFFGKLGRRYGSSQEFVPALLQSHPVSAERVAEARGRARQLPAQSHQDSLAYGLAKARLQVLTAPTAQAAMDHFQSAVDSQDPAQRYGLALSLMRLSLADNAERVFRALAADYPHVIAFRIGQAEALMASGLTEQALSLYAESERLFPRNVPMTISYAEALIDAGQPAAAHRLLLDLLNNVPPTPSQIELIARAANAAGDVANAQYYMGEYHLAMGNLPLAISQVRMALENPDVNDVDRARFRAKLDEWLSYLPEEERIRRGEDEPDKG
jgi:predicted Zn-dependent protease